MTIEHRQIHLNDISIPAIRMISGSKNLAIIIHGYGGNKEEIIGLSTYLFFKGIDSVTVDLRGHGESTDSYSMEVMDDINCIIEKYRDEKTIIAIGHSLGGRLALLSDADIKIGISPALGKDYSDQTKAIIRNMRSYRVREASDETNFMVLHNLDEITVGNHMILYGTRDVPEIIGACERLNGSPMRIERIESAFHHDIYVNHHVFRTIDAFIHGRSQK